MVKVGRMYPPHLSFLLSLPDFVFVPLMPFLVKIDENAKSSTLEGEPTLHTAQQHTKLERSSIKVVFFLLLSPRQIFPEAEKLKLII
jgi:hypothetical protein